MFEKRIHFMRLLLSLLLLLLIPLVWRVMCKPAFGISQIAHEDLQSIILEKEEVATLSDRLLINGEKVPYEKIEDKFYIPQSLIENRWQGQLSLKDKKPSEEIYMVASNKNKKDAMAANVPYQICFVDKDEATYQISEIVISGMPIMNISGNEMKLFCANDSNVLIDTSDIDYEQRGQTTYYYEKKSYNLKLLDGKKSLVGLRDDDDWILNALYDDIGLIHNQLSYQIWNEISAVEKKRGNCTVNQEYVELLLDGEYQGVYALTERLDKKVCRLADEDILFKIKGYPRHSGKDAIILKYPKENNLDAEELKTVIFDHFGDFNDIPLENSLILLDYQNALDYSLFCQLATAADNVIKNSFIIGRKTDDYYKVSEVPWDCNITWGIKNYIFSPEERIYDTDFKSVVVRILEEKDENRVKTDEAKRWFLLRKDVFSEANIKSILDENFSVLHNSGAYERNYMKWPTVTLNYEEGEEIINQAPLEIWKDENIYHFVEKRLVVIDEYYAPYVADNK